MNLAAKKGLGTGLNALFGEAEKDDREEIQQLPISRVEPREGQPRTNFDEASLQELAQKAGVRGYIHGSGNISAAPVPYLTYLSMLSAMKRLLYNELDISIKI